MSMLKLLTIAEVAEMLKVSRLTVWHWVRTGRLQAYRLGRQYRIPEKAVLALLEPITPR